MASGTRNPFLSRSFQRTLRAGRTQTQSRQKLSHAPPVCKKSTCKEDTRKESTCEGVSGCEKHTGAKCEHRACKRQPYRYAGRVMEFRHRSRRGGCAALPALPTARRITHRAPAAARDAARLYARRAGAGRQQPHEPCRRARTSPWACIALPRVFALHGLCRSHAACLRRVRAAGRVARPSVRTEPALPVVAEV